MKILIIKFSSIGDIILSTSPLRSIRYAYPNADIHFLTLDTFSPLLEGHPDIDQLLILIKSAKYSDIKRTGKHLNDSRYDLVIDLHNTLRSKIICKQIRKSPKHILKKPRWNRFKLFYFHRNDFPTDFSQIQLLHTPIRSLLSKVEHFPYTHLYISDTEKMWATDYLNNFNVPERYVVLVPGAAWPQKRWLVDHYKSIAQKLIQNNIGVVILGGENDIICEDISIDISGVADLHGKTNLRESLAIISTSNCVLGSDTGLLHGAEALRVQVVMITGPTSRETGAGTNLKESVTLENSSLSCRPCSQNGKRKCHRREQYCMTEISVDLVWHELKRMLDV